jgi:hypothetical protein
MCGVSSPSSFACKSRLSIAVALSPSLRAFTEAASAAGQLPERLWGLLIGLLLQLLDDGQNAPQH